MPIRPSTFLSDLQRFSVASMAWCSSESEAETTRIFDTLNTMIDDVRRRSSMSQKAVEAVIFLQDEVRALQGGKPQGEDNVVPLLDLLDRLSTDHVEIRELTAPIIEALQFQDRLRQNLENMGKILAVWLEQRGTLAEGKGGVDEKLTALGAAFMTCTTTMEERDLIRSLIPGLPEEQKVDDAILF